MSESALGQEAQTQIQSTGQWKQHFHVPPVLAGARPRKVYQERRAASGTVEMTLTKDLEEVGSPQDLLVSQSIPVMIPHGPSSKMKILITLRKKEKNKDVNEKSMWLQMLAGVRCQSLCSKSAQPHLILKEEKIYF